MGAVSGIVGAGVEAGASIGESYAQSKALKSRGQFQEQQLLFNSQLAEIEARDAETRGKKEQAELGKFGRKLIGSQRAALAGQNVDVSFGSALDVQEDTRQQVQEDLKTIKANAWREAFGYKLQAVDYASQGRFARLEGNYMSQMTLISGGLKALTGVAKGVNSGVSSYYGGG